MNYTIVKSSQLGINCWSARRFCGGRCQMVMYCDYPEKEDCKAVQAEIDYLNNYYKEEIDRLQSQHAKSLEILNKRIGKSINRLSG